LRVPAHEREKKTKEKEKEQIVEVALRHKPNLEKVIWAFSYIYIDIDISRQNIYLSI